MYQHHDRIKCFSGDYRTAVVGGPLWSASVRGGGGGFIRRLTRAVSSGTVTWSGDWSICLGLNRL